MDVADAVAWISANTNMSPQEAERRLRAGWRFTRELGQLDTWTTPEGSILRGDNALDLPTR